VLNRFLECLLFMLCLTFSACWAPSWHFGLGGKYNQANMELLRGRGADLDKAIANLESIVQEDPSYRDSLTLLGKAYYRKGRYYDAFAILQRALAVNKDDEIAWLYYGLTQIKVGENEKGLETIRGGLTLLGKAMRNNYRDYPAWDPRGTVRATLNRAVFQALKGLPERENLIQATEVLLARVDEEEWFQRRGRDMERDMVE
jgi:tetratricopeptide (TPR) repeat protein